MSTSTGTRTYAGETVGDVSDDFAGFLTNCEDGAIAIVLSHRGHGNTGAGLTVATGGQHRR